jgi:hypothetical protein
MVETRGAEIRKQNYGITRAKAGIDIIVLNVSVSRVKYRAWLQCVVNHFVLIQSRRMEFVVLCALKNTSKVYSKFYMLMYL